MSESGESEDRTRLDGFELEIFKLVRKGATSEQWREWLRVPLEHAAADGNMDLFTRLMDAGADGSAGWRGCFGRTLLGAAAYGKNKEVVIALLRAGAKDDVDVKFGEQRESALHVAAAYGAEAASNTLMLAGADPNVVDRRGRSPLHLAAREGYDGVVSDLLARGAHPNQKTRGPRETPLHFAAKGGQVSCVSKLLLGGAEQNPRDSIGSTPLYRAAICNDLGAVEQLLAAKADLDIRVYHGYGPLDAAAYEGHSEVLRALLRHGGDIKACDDKGYTALHHAANNDNLDRDNSGAIRDLLEAGADVEAKTTDDQCKTPLHVAMCSRNSSSGRLCVLLEGGADVNARNADGSTPLHFACCHSNVGGVELLLRWGADETLVDEDGDTPADGVGMSERGDGSGNEERKADDQRIRHMLARAPADRSWRRRGWLVLARSRPDRMQLTNDNNRSSNGDSPAKVAKARCDSLGEGEGVAGEQAMIGLGSLVRRVVGLDAEGVFRLVIGFL